MPGTMFMQGPPGSIPSDIPGPIESMDVSRLNEMYLSRKQVMADRLEADSNGYHTVYSH